MCGISGIYGNELNIEVVQRMNNAMSLRGPDDFGSWLNNNKTICLGQTRLSIIDLSENAHQPMQSADLRYTLVFNGEIYNYKEIRLELLNTTDTKFKSDSDTEVILEAWKKWGKSCVQKFRGMFAFAIWDEFEKVLFLVRDRLGIKPLLYLNVNNQFIFASNLSAILANDLLDKKIKLESLSEYFLYGSVFQPNTMIENVYTLMPATILTYKNGNLTTEKYWEIEKDTSLSNKLARYKYQDLVQMTRNKLEEACKYHLISDVPIGSFLSGGVDSTSITALMAKQSPYKIKTFSIGFENDKYYKNELGEAKKASDFIGTEHYEQVVTSKTLKNSFEEYINGIDQPSADGINTFLVSKLAHKHVKVVLSGLGADEIFAGYDHFNWLNSKNRFMPTNGNQILSKSYKFFLGLGKVNLYNTTTLSTNEKFNRLRAKLTISDFDQLFSESILNNKISSYGKSYGNSNLNVESIYDISLLECNNYLLNTLLRDSDALSMANSLELRPVFLDHELVQFALSLPDNVKVKDGELKSILKDATSDLLPKNFTKKPKKGFELPINRWLIEDMRDFVEDALKDNYADIFFNREYINQILKNIGSQQNNSLLLQILVFVSWAKKNRISN